MLSYNATYTIFDWFNWIRLLNVIAIYANCLCSSDENIELLFLYKSTLHH